MNLALPLVHSPLAGILIVAFLLTASLSRAQSPIQSNVTITNLQGRVYSNVNVLKIEKDGILLRYGDEFRYDRMKFTNMSEAVQLRFGYDPKRIAQEEEARLERIRQQATFAETALRAKRDEALRDAAESVLTIKASDFPKNTNAVQVCRQVAYELKGLQTAIELGVTYQKYSDLLTDTAISIGKMRDNNPDALPPIFAAKLDSSLASYTSARSFWKLKIDTNGDTQEARSEYFLQWSWKKATLALTYCIAIAEQRANIIDSLTQQATELLIFEEMGRRKKLNVVDTSGPVFQGLQNDQIKALFTEFLKTNSPSMKLQ